MEFFSFFDFFYAILLSFFLYFKAKKKYGEEGVNQYYSKGLLFKLIAVFIFCFIYMFYYQGGDTINYYQGISAFYKLFWLDPSKFFSLILQDSNYEYYLDFSINQVGFPPKYMFKDSRTLLVIKLSTILSFPGLGGYIATSVLLANLTYKWIWKGFEFVATRYSTIQKLIAVSFLYLPSVVFWGSGIMKDTFSFAASCFALYGINQIFVEKKK